MKLLNLFKKLFIKKKKLNPKESVILHGMPYDAQLKKKNLTIIDGADVVVLSNGNPIACGEVNLAQMSFNNNKGYLELMYLTAPIPKGSNLKLIVNGIIYDPYTNIIEYTFSTEINDAVLSGVNQVKFNVDSIVTTILSKDKE